MSARVRSAQEARGLRWSRAGNSFHGVHRLASALPPGILVGRRALSLRALGLAATAVLLLQPAQLLGPSFQMSFAAVLALIAGWERARPLLAARPAREGRRMGARQGGASRSGPQAGGRGCPPPAPGLRGPPGNRA